MKYVYNYHCLKCVRYGIGSRQDYIILISDSENSFEIKCKRGHKKTIVYEDEKYNMLFTSAMECIRDGNLREAIANLAASYERLLEYAIKIIGIKNKIDETHFNSTWKSLKNQSERQYGAFSLLYLLNFNEAPPVYKDASVTFRNAVIHKGLYPTFKETTSFAQATFELMVEILFQLTKACNKIIVKQSKTSRLELEKKRTPNGILSIIRIGSFLDFDYNTGKPTINHMNKQFDNWKKSFSNLN
jgi:hypothetical protein